MVEALAVVPIGRTSWSKSAVSPYDTSEANLLSRYSNSGAVCSVNSPVSGLKVLASAAWQRQWTRRGLGSRTTPKAVRKAMVS